MLVLRGAYRLSVAQGARTLLPGALVLAPPRAELAVQRGPDAEAVVAIFPASFLDPLALGAGAGAAVDILTGTVCVAVRLGPEDHRQAREIFALLERETEAGRAGREAMIRVKLLEALLLFTRGAEGPGRPAGPGRRAFDVEEAKRWLREHCADELSLAVVAARYGLNPTYLSRLFHQHAGMPLVQYLNRARIERSCQFLKRTNASVAEIALAVGYNNLSYFNRCFRSLMGMSPRVYRSASEDQG